MSCVRSHTRYSVELDFAFFSSLEDAFPIVPQSRPWAEGPFQVLFLIPS